MNWLGSERLGPERLGPRNKLGCKDRLRNNKGLSPRDWIGPIGFSLRGG